MSVKCIIIILITYTVFAHADFDKLVLEDDTETLGEYAYVEQNMVYFKQTNGLAFQGVPISQVRSLKLKNGKTIIIDEYLKIRTDLDYENLSAKDKVIYDANGNAR